MLGHVIMSSHHFQDSLMYDSLLCNLFTKCSVHVSIHTKTTCVKIPFQGIYSSVNICYQMNFFIADNSDKKGQQCFKWKYTPSCDSDLPSPELPNEDFVVRITPLKTCGKPLRLGLSKRQPMSKSLHKIFKHQRNKSSCKFKS